MSRLATTVTTSTTVELAPEVSVELLTLLRDFESLSVAVKSLEAEKDEIKRKVDAALGADAHALEAGIEVEGYRAKMVHPTRDVLDHMKLISLGVTTAQLQQATKTVPTKSYLLITPPKPPKA